MTQLRMSIGVAVFTAAALFCFVPVAAGQHEGEGKGHEAPHPAGHDGPRKYTVKLHGVAEEKIYDLRNPAHLRKVQDHLSANEIEKLAAEEEINIFPAAWDLGIWTVVVFLLLMTVLSRIAWAPMLEGLKKREDNIHQAIHEAARLREESETLRRQLEKQMQEASEKVRQLHEEARKKAEEASAAMIAQTRAELKEERDRLQQELAVARDQALADLWAQTATLATQVSSRALRRSIDSDDHRRLVDEALAEIKSATQDRQREVASSRI